MNCPSNEQWSAFVDREARPEERTLLEAHLPGCESCRLTLASLRAAKNALAAEPAPAMPVDLRRSLRERIREMEPEPSPWWTGWRPVVAFAMAAAVLFLVLWVGKKPEPIPVAATPSVPADLLLAAHDRFASTMPLASKENIVAEPAPQLAGAPEEARDVY